MTQLPDTGWVAVVKRDCPTCELTEPVLAALAKADRDALIRFLESL